MVENISPAFSKIMIYIAVIQVEARNNNCFNLIEQYQNASTFLRLRDRLKNPYKKLRILKSGKIGSNVYHKLAV